MRNSNYLEVGKAAYELCEQLFPICRSITGNGFRDSIRALQKIVPELQLKSLPSGLQCFDWKVPKEWNINAAYVLGPDGKKIIDFKNSNLHVVNYSTPIDAEVTLSELQEHLYSLPDQPNVIPYITSYYQERWGFCLTHDQRERLVPGKYKVKIDSTLKDGELNYAEFILPGESDRTVFISTYLCHPSMANNELSGPAVSIYLASWLASLKSRQYTYRFVFIPETIGSIAYLSLHKDELQQNVFAGFNLTCLGDDNHFSFMPSRLGVSYSDYVAKLILSNLDPEFLEYSFLTRGSDERQYCSPRIDLPMVSIMRSKYGEYDEYHTSADNLSFISAEGLGVSYRALRTCIEHIESDSLYENEFTCEPQLGKRGLYPTIGTGKKTNTVANMMNLIAYCDGRTPISQVASYIGVSREQATRVARTLCKNGVLRKL